MMQKGQNHNHPQKGSRIEVEPIRSEKDIKAIIQLLDSQPRNQLFFIMGINNGLRVGDLLRVTVGDVRYLRTGEVHQLIEAKTGKKNILVINKGIQKALNYYFAIEGGEDHQFLFRSRKGENTP